MDAVPSIRPPTVGLTLLFSLVGCGGGEPGGDLDSDPGVLDGVALLAQGGPFRGVNGIHFGPDGRLYLASVVTPAVAAIDPDNGDILELWGEAEGALSPDDVTFGPDGSAYWTDIAHGVVTRRSPDGTSRVVADLGAGVNPITFSDDGRLFVSQCFLDDKLYEVDPEGMAEARLVNGDLGPGCGLNGMDWSPIDGKLYGPRWFAREVVRVDVETGGIETVAAGFGVPAAVKFDSRGRLHVLDALRGQVVRVDLESGGHEVVATLQPGLDNLAFGPDDRLFVSSYADGFIVEVLSPTEHRTVIEGGINIPGGLALHQGGLYLADFFALRRLDPNTGEDLHTVRDVIGFSAQGSVMSVQSTGEHLVLTSWFDNAVRIWDPSGDSLITTFQAAAPIDAIGFDGDVVATEYGTGEVVRFSTADPEGRTTLASGIDGPAGLATDGDELYVSENHTGRILKLLPDGTTETLAEGLSSPEGLAIADRLLYVVEAGAGRLMSIDLDTGDTVLVGEGLETNVPATGVFPRTMIFNGIAVGDGRAYVSGDKISAIYTVDLN
jgi:sugar lactone lactonase YvrE